MRRAIAAAIVAVLALAPGSQAAHGAERTKSASANAFWYFRRNLSAEEYLRSVWYVGAYRYDGRLWSDLYKSTARCIRREGRDRCREVSFRVGVVRRLDSFRVDRRLSTGYLEGTYPLQTYREGEKVGDPVPTHIASELEGVGGLSRYRDTYTFHDGCTVFRYDFKGLSRRAEAHGVLEGRDLGETYRAWLSRGGSLSVEHEC